MLVEVYTKPGCSLCDEMLELLEDLQQAQPFELVERNIFEREGWFEAYRHRIPVVAIDGVEVLHLRFTHAQLLAAFGQRQKSPT